MSSAVYPRSDATPGIVPQFKIRVNLDCEVVLETRGNASKVALVAVARKLLVLTNALIRTMKPCENRANSVCPDCA